MSFDSKGVRYCDNCGHEIPKATRVYLGNDYCLNCYGRYFVPSVCTRCQGPLRRHIHDESPPICYSCRNIDRACPRCGNPVPKAGLISDRQAVCPSCVPFFKTPRPCEECGRLSSRLSAAPSLGVTAKICPSCRLKRTNKTCSICRKYRPVAIYREEHPVCAKCAVPEGAPPSHSCPNCGDNVPGTGAARCRACTNLSRLLAEVELEKATLESTWNQDLLSGFALWLFERHRSSPNLLSKFRRHREFFTNLDTRFTSLGAITGQTLLVHFKVNWLRSHLLPMRYLKDRFSIQIDPVEKTEAADLRRVHATVQASADKPWGSLIGGFAAHLLASGLKRKTVRLYVHTADLYCSYAGSEPEMLLTQDCIINFLRESPGSRTNLSPFLGHISRPQKTRPKMPDPRSYSLPRQRVKTVPQLAKALFRIQTQGVENVEPAILRVALAVAFGFKPMELVQTDWTLEEDALGRLHFTGKGERFLVPEELKGIALRWMGSPQN